MNREALLTSPEALRRIRDMKLNPLASLTAQSLVRDLNSFDYGSLRNAALLFEAIANRDDTIPGVKGKREKEISQMECAVVVTGEKTQEAEDHKQVLEQFWNNVTAVNAYDRDERGGFKRLVKQMMTAVSFKYACHHIVWEPRRTGLRATFQFVPLWLFENKTGQLRYLEQPYAEDGELMPRDRWMVTTGDGLMIPCSIGYFFKRDGLNNLAIFSDKFSVPGVVGATSASKDSPEGQAMANAVATYANDWAACLYDVEDPTKLPIHLIEANGNPTAMPMPEIINRVDRKFETLYRGGDLATTSSHDGEGQGASLQGKEGDINKHDDAATVEETLEQVSRQVIEYYFGANVDPLAKVTLQEARAEAKSSKLTAATTLADRGAKVSLTELAADMQVSLADEGEDILQASTSAASPVESESNVAGGPQWQNQNRDARGRFGSNRFSGIIDKASKLIDKHGGFTLSGSGDQPLRGFAVAPSKTTEEIFDRDKVMAKLDGYIRRHWNLLKRNRAHLGAWLNPDDGKVYLDVSIVVDDIDEARELAREADQIAFFDLASFTEIRTHEDQEQTENALATEREAQASPLWGSPQGRDSSRVHQANEDRPGREAGRDQVAELAAFHESSRADVEAAIAADLLPVFHLLEKAGRADSEAERNEMLRTADQVFDALTTPQTEEAYEDVLAAAFVNGLGDGPAKDEAESNSRDDSLVVSFLKLLGFFRTRS